MPPIINNHNILVTGANGFIGRNLCAFLKEKGYFVRGAVRNNVCDIPGADEYIHVGDIDESTDWQEALAGVDMVVHLVARVHVMHEHADDSIKEFRKVNVLGTERLVRMAVKAGVKRFIFASSVKVNGDGTGALLGKDLDSSASPQNDRGCMDFGLLRPPRFTRGTRNDKGNCNDKGVRNDNYRAYTEKDMPAPQDAYGISKLEAEQALARIADETGLEVVILRLPLVYGPGVKANFKSLIKMARSSLPLPFKGINNRRSFLYVGNLVDAICVCIEHPKAAGETFLVSDGQDVSTPDLIRMIAGAMEERPRGYRGFGLLRPPRFTRGLRNDVGLFYLPLGVLKALCKIIGKSEELEKLTGSLVVDSSKIRNLFGWKPPFTLEEGIRETVREYGKKNI